MKHWSSDSGHDAVEYSVQGIVFTKAQLQGTCRNATANASYRAEVRQNSVSLFRLKNAIVRSKACAAKRAY
jgi:hypothetical protein